MEIYVDIWNGDIRFLATRPGVNTLVFVLSKIESQFKLGAWTFQLLILIIFTLLGVSMSNYLNNTINIFQLAKRIYNNLIFLSFSSFISPHGATAITFISKVGVIQKFSIFEQETS